jgi:hypothetical protein
MGGTVNDIGNSIQPTSDGGYILCGTTFSNSGDVSGNHGNSDVWVVKLDALGGIQWQRCLGGTQPDNGRAIVERAGGGYLVLGDTYSNNEDVSGNHGSSDIWLVRLAENGEVEWQRCYGGALLESAAGFKAITDGEVIIAGSSRSTDGDLTSNAGSTDNWIFKVDGDGDILWQYTYGGSASDDPVDVVLTADGGCVVIGVSSSNDGDVSGNHGGVYDAWVFKLDVAGGLEWQRACGGGETDLGRAIVQRSDGSYLALGSTDSNDGDLDLALGANDLWSFELSPTGQLVSSLSFGGSSNDNGAGLAMNPEGGAVFFGSSSSNDGDLTENQGSFDGWFLRAGMDGVPQWSISLGGSLSDSFTAGVRTADGGYVAIGQSNSNDGDLPGNNGAGDVWIVKLGPDPVGIQEGSRSLPLKLYPNPCHERLTVYSTQPLGATPQWSIVNVQGQLVDRGRLGGPLNVIDVSMIDPGTYNLILEHDAGSTSTSFVKE